MRPATPNAPPNTPRRLVNRFILASHHTCRSFLRASLSERVHYPILTILTEGGWTGLDCAPSTRFLPSPERVAALTPTARIERAPSECARSNTHFLLFSQRVAGPGSTARVTEHTRVSSLSPEGRWPGGLRLRASSPVAI